MADTLSNSRMRAESTLGSQKEYQTLFWVPMLFQTAKNAENLIEEMLDMIQDFHDHDSNTPVFRKSIAPRKAVGAPKRRQQILGEIVDSEVVTTRVDVVLKSENTKYTLLSVLKRHFLFSQLRDYELEDVIDVMQSQYASEDDLIIEQGDPGELFYILEEGTCEILIDGESLGIIEGGSSFGDLALMYNCPRAATIKAVAECTLWTLDRVFFRQAMVTSSSNQNIQLSQFLSKISLFESIGVQKLNQLARSLTKQSYEDGHYIIRQGDIGDQFYVIYKGTVSVSMTDDSGNEKFLLDLGEGEVFGERALIKKEPRKANIVANGPVECYYLESQDFYSMLGEFVEKFTQMNEFRIIRSASVFDKLNDNRLKEVINQQLSSNRMFSGQRLVCGVGQIIIVLDGQFQSSNGDVYASGGLIQIGSLEQTADEVAGALTVMSDEGVLASISREALLETLKKSETDERRSRRVSSLNMDNSGARGSSLGSGAGHDSGSSTLSTGSGGGAGSGGGSNADVEREIQIATERRRETSRKRRQSLAKFMCGSLEELELVQPLGRGTFGSVYLCRQKDTRMMMALKCLDKKALIESGQHHYVRREIIALENFQHPFLANYYGVILSPRKICLLLEFIPGGELWSYLYDEEHGGGGGGVFDDDGDEIAGVGRGKRRTRGPFGGLEVGHAALYAGTVLLALEHIHGLGYSYRDLKPENLLISSNGYLRLVDFGFAKQVPFISKAGTVQFRTFTLCGTPDYMAPELVLTQGHDKSIDYWAFGVLVYELICGHTPFESSNQQRTFEKIVHSQKHLGFPPDFDPHCKSLIRRLLHSNAALRFGCLQKGIDDIKDHAFFAMQGMDFDKLLAQELEMPYLPLPFEPKPPCEDGGVSKPHGGDIEPLDLELERTVQVEDDFDSYFQNLNQPDLLEEAAL